MFQFFMSSQVILHSIVHFNTLVFPKELGIWCHNRGKISNETYAKLCHSIEHLDLLRSFRYWHFDQGFYFLRIKFSPSLETMNPGIVLEQTMDAQSFGFKLMPSSLHLKIHYFSFSKWVDRSLKIVKSFKKIFMNTSMYSWKFW